nr:beta-defensin 2 [Pelodiscus huangshanensis]
MKILYLLFAVFFLVLQSFPGCSRLIHLDRVCELRGGSCFRRCYFPYSWIAPCSGGRSCCESRKIKE